MSSDQTYQLSTRGTEPRSFNKHTSNASQQQRHKNASCAPKEEQSKFVAAPLDRVDSGKSDFLHCIMNSALQHHHFCVIIDGLFGVRGTHICNIAARSLHIHYIDTSEQLSLFVHDAAHFWTYLCGTYRLQSADRRDNFHSSKFLFLSGAELSPLQSSTSCHVVANLTDNTEFHFDRYVSAVYSTR